MSKSLEEIYAELVKVEGGAEMVADLKSQISKLRDEAASNRITKNQILDQLGVRNGDNTQAALNNLIATLNAVKNVGDPQALGNQLKSLQDQLKDIQGKYDAAEKKAKAEHDANIKASINAQVIKALTDGKAINPTEMSKILLANVAVGDDDKITYKDGDKELTIADGVSGWLKANPWAIKADIQPGAGGGHGAGGVGAKYSLDDLKGMSRAEINAHWDEISKGGIAEPKN